MLYQEKVKQGKLPSAPFNPHMPSLITVSQLVEQLPTSAKPQSFLMSHLLASGFRGSEYQLLVLLERLSALYAEHHQDKTISFAASVEEKNRGNFDDICLDVNKNGQLIAAELYQIKYYNHPITFRDFFNDPDTFSSELKQESTSTHGTKATEKTVKSKKNEKMHIGKFFEGWLTWKDEHSQEQHLSLRGIIYSNTHLGVTLKKIVSNNKFSSDFIESWCFC